MKTLAFCLACLTTACASDLDTTRESVDTGSFGTRVVTLACKRIAYLDDLQDGDGRVDVRGDTFREVCRNGLMPPDSASDTLRALQAERSPLIAAIDAAMPEAFLPDMQAFLTTDEFLSIYDDGKAIAAVDALIAMLELAADDAELPRALERLHHRVGYRPLTPALGAMRAVAEYPELSDFLSTFLAETTESGSAAAEWDALIAALGVTLRNASPAEDVSSPDRTGTLARELLFAERSLLGTSQTIPLALRDERGLVRVAVLGSELAPFADTDGDSLADADDLGRFVDAAGNVLAAPSPFELGQDLEAEPWPYRDAETRALTQADGPLLYEYVDLDKTLFAALFRDAADLFDPQKGTALDAVQGASGLLGPRQATSRTYENGERIEYLGHDTSASPLLDMVYGYLQVLRYPQIVEVLALSRQLFTTREAEVSRLVEAVIQAARLGDLHPGLALDPQSPLWDDLIPVLRDIVNTPGLAEDVMKVLERPEIAALGPALASYMKYKDQFSYDPYTQAVIGSLATEVDRTQPDSNFNRSLMQRLVHLVADSSGLTLCNKQDAAIRVGINLATYDECELLRIEDVAVFYVQSMAYLRDENGDFVYEDGKPVPAAEFPFNWGWIGIFITDGIIESMVGIDGFRTHPTPQALNRTLLLDPAPAKLQDMIDPPVCRDGHLYKTGHGGTLPVWEATNFYQLVQPLVQPFVDRGKEALFVKLLVVLHSHWPSRDSINHQNTLPGEANYAYASNLAAYEPLIADILDQDALLPALVETAPALGSVTVGGRSYATILLDAARYILAPRAGLHKRDGSTESTTADGRPVTTLSLWQILADAYALKHAQVRAGGDAAAWPGAMSELMDVLVRGEDVPGQGWHFRNPRTVGVVVAVLDFLQSRMSAHRSAGDLDAWLTDDLPGRLEEVLTGPLVPALADLVAGLQASPDAREHMESLVSYLATEASQDSFRTMLTSMADLFQLALDDRDMIPIARFLGEVLRPERGWIDSQLAMVQAISASDRTAALPRLLRNMYAPYRPGRTALGDLIDGLSEVHRARPYADLKARYTEADYRALMRGITSFLDDEKRGLRKFIAIMEGRNL